ncbi:hypothetical protein EDB84DRAFT_1445117, partial [Lactarius hengduanensis]
PFNQAAVLVAAIVAAVVCKSTVAITKVLIVTTSVVIVAAVATADLTVDTLVVAANPVVIATIIVTAVAVVAAVFVAVAVVNSSPSARHYLGRLCRCCCHLAVAASSDAIVISITASGWQWRSRGRGGWGGCGDDLVAVGHHGVSGSGSPVRAREGDDSGVVAVVLHRLEVRWKEKGRKKNLAKSLWSQVVSEGGCDGQRLWGEGEDNERDDGGWGKCRPVLPSPHTCAPWPPPRCGLSKHASGVHASHRSAPPYLVPIATLPRQPTPHPTPALRAHKLLAAALPTYKTFRTMAAAILPPATIPSPSCHHIDLMICDHENDNDVTTLQATTTAVTTCQSQQQWQSRRQCTDDEEAISTATDGNDEDNESNGRGGDSDRGDSRDGGADGSSEDIDRNRSGNCNGVLSVVSSL